MTTYTKHPAGYPQTVLSIQGRAGHWYVMEDTWHTATSHDGARRISGPYRTRSEAEAAIANRDSESR